MFALALAVQVGMTPGPAELLVRNLTVADLRKSGKVLYRKINAAIRPVGSIWSYGSPLTRVQGDASMLLVDWIQRDFGNYVPPLLIYADRGRLKAQLLPDINGLGWHWASFRRLGRHLVGGGYVYQGNWATPAVMSFEWSGKSWQLSLLRAGEREVADIGFAFRKGGDMRVALRSYYFRALTAPHAGPLLNYESVWRFRNGKIYPGRLRRVNNALAAFDDLVDAICDGKGRVVREFIPNSHMRLRFVRAVKAIQPPISVVCVDSYNLERGNVFGVEDSGSAEGRRTFCQFARTKAGWRVIKVGDESEFPSPRPSP